MSTTDLRRIRENISMAHSSMQTVEECLAKARKYTEDDSDEQALVQSLGLFAEQLRRRLLIAVDDMARKEAQREK